MSTLPRTRSLGRADGSILSLKRDRSRPTSLCEASWVRINPNPGQDLRQEMLRRIPSQANNLCTTVPTSLVTRNLGGRHAPTKSSLRHSRMLVAKTGNKGAHQNRRWATSGRDLGRIGPLVISAQILVGLMAIVLVVWFLLWTPFLKFYEIPHYAALPLFFSGIFGAILLRFTSKTRSCIINSFKGIVAFMCCISIIACVCACVFASFHLFQLAPMECTQRDKLNIAIDPIQPELEEDFTPPEEVESLSYSDEEPKLPEKLEVFEEGSGFVYHDDEDIHTQRPQETPITSAFTQQLDSVNTSDCICENWRLGWRIELVYPNLNCGEVKNLLPILLVATCVVTTVGAVLSGVIVYMLWVTRRTFPRTAIASELRPFIYKSQFRTSGVKNQNTFINGGLYR